MAKCKYPNEVCANMTVLHGETYCDSVPCSLKDEVQKQTNADRIRNMTDEELAIIIMCPYDGTKEGDCFMEERNCIQCCKEWLQAEVKEGADDE